MGVERLFGFVLSKKKRKGRKERKVVVRFATFASFFFWVLSMI